MFRIFNSIEWALNGAILSLCDMIGFQGSCNWAALSTRKVSTINGKYQPERLIFSVDRRPFSSAQCSPHIRLKSQVETHSDTKPTYSLGSPLVAHQRNTLKMAICWPADWGPLLYAKSPLFHDTYIKVQQCKQNSWGPQLAHRQNAIKMAFCWWSDGDPFLMLTGNK